ncbi:dTDP-4-amino-4,6-dideoxygalactose transaminase [Planctomycetes bacterium Poly30]|uniref:dTDP-4-amino-4,6-dideoxygalactose transaminase n=1 Tax=Saltatorellus ferox TaxID=2528018 RepID=A0A518EZW3_9BACT|nr:dTDP-4-amino-4,6-dideoxygalactose transaminase [Planctomycetes bacterium Poly30]
MSAREIPFNRPYVTGRELSYVAEAHRNGQLAGNGPFTRRCQAWLEERIGCYKALLTHSCTAALEMAATLCEVQAGDEVILPSFTFVSTANAFVARGATPVFVDIRPDTLNLDGELVVEAISERTKVIVPVHYAGVGCDLTPYQAIARERGIFVVEDAAHSILATDEGRSLGSIGDLAAFSFHETKNLSSGQGGALAINDERLAARAEIIWQKGTNRSDFCRGAVDQYTWIDQGSSYLPGEIPAAFLSAQMEEADLITERRLAIWQTYHRELEGLEQRGWLRRPCVPEGSGHNAHIYHVLLSNAEARTRIIEFLRRKGIGAVFHYVPLHTSPAGRRYGREAGELTVTEDIAARLLRLPLWLGIEPLLPRVLRAVGEFFDTVEA